MDFHGNFTVLHSFLLVKKINNHNREFLLRLPPQVIQGYKYWGCMEKKLPCSSQAMLWECRIIIFLFKELLLSVGKGEPHRKDIKKPKKKQKLWNQ